MNECYFHIPKANKPYVEAIKKLVAFAKKEGKGFVKSLPYIQTTRGLSVI